MKKLLFLSTSLFILCLGYGQQSKLTKIPLTKIEQNFQKFTFESVLFSEVKAASGTAFRPVKSTKDKLNQTHTTYQQYYKGIKVELGAIKLHEKNGIATSYNGAYFDVSGINISTQISTQQAITSAKQFFGNEEVFWLTESGFTDDPLLSIKKVIVPNRRTEELNLAYAIGIGTFRPTHQMGTLYINAIDGSVLKFKNQVLACFEGNHKENSKNHISTSLTAPVATGTGYAAYTGSVNFETKLDGSEYVLNDETRATGNSWNLSTQGVGTKTGIITLDMRTGTDYVNGPMYEFTDNDNNWTPAEMITDDNVYAIDVHWGSELVYDFWKNENSWNSYNGSNSALMSLVHYDNNLTNAAWGAISSTSGFMLYGDGAGSYSPLTSLDVVAHEIAHGVNNATSNLDYELESGALNEGLSDIWAMIIENYANANYGTSNDISRINDQNVGGAFRSLSNPNAYGQPDTYGGTFWYDVSSCTPNGTTNDYCGVHTNSGVLNYWFWLLSQGGTGTNDLGDTFDVTAIAIDDAADIVWRMQRNYLTSTSDFADARGGAIQSAVDLFGACSQQEQSVTNAFYAVGVGAAYVAGASPSITNHPSDSTIETGTTGQLSVSGSDYTSISWEYSDDNGNSWNTITDGTNFSGSSATTLSMLNLTENTEGYLFRATLTNDCGSATSNNATVTVISYTSIPDSNFETALDALGYDNILGDGQVPTHLIENITNLDIGGSNITDLTGIEDFTALEELNVNTNSLTTIDISNNTNLTYFNCRYNTISTIDLSTNTSLEVVIVRDNTLTSLDISNNLALIEIYVQDNSLATLDISSNTMLDLLGIARNPISSLDLSTNTNLTELYATGCALTDIDFSNNTNIKVMGLEENNLESCNLQNGNNTAVITFNITNNPNLECILVDDATHSTDNWTNIDAQSFFSEIDCRYTTIPDSNFEAALDALGYDDISGDGQVPTSLIEDLISLNVSNENISDLTGIEDFGSIENLYINGNNLTDIELSNNRKLEWLQCQDNNLSALDISENTFLRILDCSNNPISDLDFSTNNDLMRLDISGTTITAIDVHQNVLLLELRANNSDLTTLDLSTIYNVKDLYISNSTIESINLQNGTNVEINDIELTSNQNLTCVLVDDAVYSTTNWTSVDASVNFSNTNYCDYTAIPDTNFEAVLEALGYDDISDDGQVPTELINVVTNLDISSDNISDVTGLEDFAMLQWLDVSNNNLTSIDISNNIDLEFIDISENQITSIDVSQNIELTEFIAENTDLSALDLSNNSDIVDLYVTNSAIEYIDLRNGFNQSIDELELTDNPNLTCISVDDANYSATNWITIDAAISFTETNYCDYTAILDANFETALEALGYDDISGDEQVPTDLIKAITHLNLDRKNISDFTGVEDFTSLIQLECGWNSMTSIDLSNNLLLEEARFNNCNLTSINVSGLTVLEKLQVNENQIETIDISTNTSLKNLTIGDNLLENIDITNNIALETMYCGQNAFTTIDFSNNPSLEELELFRSPNLISLDLSQNGNLIYLDLSNTGLTDLNIQNGNNVNISGSDFYADDNPNLTCIKVDDVAYSTTNWTRIDAQTSFSETTCDRLVIAAKVFLQGAALNPNTGEESLMRDDLRVADYIPTTSPYTDGLTVDSSVLTTTGNDAIVDWVWVELRDATTNTTIMASQSALLQRDGDIVTTDGISNLEFDQQASGDYYIAIKHRNHLGVMTSGTVSLSSVVTTVDFTDGSIVTYGTNGQTTYGMPTGVSAMWAGDAGKDGTINLIGTSNDSNEIRDAILNDPINQAIQFYGFNVTGYNDADVNLTGGTQIIGSDNDANLIRDNILNHPINTFIQFYGFSITEQLPENVTNTRIAMDLLLIGKMEALASKNK